MSGSRDAGRTDLMWFVRSARDHDAEGKILTCLEGHWGTVDETIDDRFLLKDYWDAGPDESVKTRRGDDKRKADRARNLRDPEPILKILLAGRLKTLRNQRSTALRPIATRRGERSRGKRHCF